MLRPLTALSQREGDLRAPADDADDFDEEAAARERLADLRGAERRRLTQRARRVRGDAAPAGQLCEQLRRSGLRQEDVRKARDLLRLGALNGRPAPLFCASGSGAGAGVTFPFSAGCG